MAFGADDRIIRVCDTVSWETEKMLSGHDGTVWCLAVQQSTSPDVVPVLVSGAADRTIRIWNTLTWMLQGVIDQHSGVVRSVGFHPTDPNVLISGASDRTIRLFKVKTQEPDGLLQGPFGSVRAAAFVQGSTIVVGCGDGVFGMWREEPEDVEPQKNHAERAERLKSNARKSIGDWPQLNGQVARDAPWKRINLTGVGNYARPDEPKTDERAKRRQRDGESALSSSRSTSTVTFAADRPAPAQLEEMSGFFTPGLRRVNSEPMVNTSQVVANAVLRSGPQASLSTGSVRKLRQQVYHASETGIIRRPPGSGMARLPPRAPMRVELAHTKSV
jgi:WD40 repeat protein